MNPGEPTAHDAGCTCPEKSRQDELRNTMPRDMVGTFHVIHEDCPMHGKPAWRDGSSIH